jgi:hypothetical protein
MPKIFGSTLYNEGLGLRDDVGLERAEKTMGGFQDQGKTVMLVAREDPASWLMAVMDKIRPDSAERERLGRISFGPFSKTSSLLP